MKGHYTQVSVLGRAWTTLHSRMVTTLFGVGAVSGCQEAAE